MSYLYTMFAGSLADLRSRLDAVDLTDPDAVERVVEEHDPEAYELFDEVPLESGLEEPTVLSALITGTWTPSPGERINWLDWHEEDAFLEQAASRLPDRADELLGDLFQSPPLGVSGAEWGFCGSLTHAEVVELRDHLTQVLPDTVLEDAKSDPTSRTPLASGLPVELLLAWVYLSLRDVPDGYDVAVRLG